jgi:hypothetical protein
LYNTSPPQSRLHGYPLGYVFDRSVPAYIPPPPPAPVPRSWPPPDEPDEKLIDFD